MMSEQLTPLHEFRVGDWVVTNAGTYAIVRTIDEERIAVEEYYCRAMLRYTFDEAARKLTQRTKREYKLGQRVRLSYHSEKMWGRVIGRKWSNEDEGPLTGYALVLWCDRHEDWVPFYTLEPVSGVFQLPLFGEVE